MCWQDIVSSIIDHFLFFGEQQLQFQMTRHSSKTKRRQGSSRGVVVKFNDVVFQKMVRDVVEDLYGKTDFGHPVYRFQSPALSSLQEGAEYFMTTMWSQVKDIAKHGGRDYIEARDVQVWKRTTDFKRRHQKSGLSLCKLFNNC